ncbi:MAG: hypothetical protein JWO36_3777 [Myxococcales bacterium]|nr:hypothetical protein [Myxococcales bacterium]
MEPTNDDAAIAEFHNAARKRKAVIFAVAAVLTILAGAAALLVAFTATPEAGPARGEIRVILLGGAMIVAGIASAITSYKIATGKILDLDS